MTRRETYYFDFTFNGLLEETRVAHLLIGSPASAPDFPGDGWRHCEQRPVRLAAPTEQRGVAAPCRLRGTRGRRAGSEGGRGKLPR